MRNIFLKILSVSLLLLLWGCSGNLVTTGIVKQGISLSLNYTQTELSQVLNLPLPTFEIRSIQIEEQKAFIQNHLPTYHLQGQYDLNLKFNHQTIFQPHNPFDIYLQEQAEGKSWRLLIPSNTSGDTRELWSSYLVEEDTK
ncbi:MAG: hypothetical protein ACOYME_03290 [Prochlorotrichaceae cyanobacterium]|jgi:hypothetical protein